MERGKLVLTLKPGQPVTIGDDVIVTFVESDEAGRARVAISAPKDVPILRVAPAPRRVGRGR